MREIRQGIQASEQRYFNVPVLGNICALRHFSAWKYYHSTSSRVGVSNKCAVHHLPSQREPLPAFHTVTIICWSCGCGIMHSVWNSKSGKFKVCKSVHHHTIQIYQPTRCNNFSSLLLEVYVQLNMFRASSCLSSGAQQLQ